MRIVRFAESRGPVSYGILQNDQVEVVKGGLFEGLEPAGRKVALRDVSLLAPVEPPNIMAFGRNYKAHAEEGGDSIPKAPLLFLKATTAVIAHGEPIILPGIAPTQIDYEAELAVVIGKPTRNVSEKDGLSHVLGYTCANDVSARDCQNADGQWARAKSFETFAPLGPWIETNLDPGNCDIACRVNGRTMQKANTSLMIFNVPYLISYLSKGMTLLPGTVLLAGTPPGCGFAQDPPLWLKLGDTVEVEIQGIGLLRNSVAAE